VVPLPERSNVHKLLTVFHLGSEAGGSGSRGAERSRFTPNPKPCNPTTTLHTSHPRHQPPTPPTLSSKFSSAAHRDKSRELNVSKIEIGTSRNWNVSAHRDQGRDWNVSMQKWNLSQPLSNSGKPDGRLSERWRCSPPNPNHSNPKPQTPNPKDQSPKPTPPNLHSRHGARSQKRGTKWSGFPPTSPESPPPNPDSRLSERWRCSTACPARRRYHPRLFHTECLKVRFAKVNSHTNSSTCSSY